MLLGGDELGRTQRGNNNGYCQDNELSWFDWEHADTALLKFTRGLIHFYRKHPVFRRRRWFQGREIRGSGVTDIGWFAPDGIEMTEEQWNEGFAKSFSVFLNGESLTRPDARGERVVDDSFYLIFNAHHEPITFRMPAQEYNRQWVETLDTSRAFIGESDRTIEAVSGMEVAGCSMKVFRRIS